MEPWKTDLLDAWRAALADARGDEAAWSALVFEPGEDENGHTADENMIARAQVLWALQYDHRVTDGKLLRFLLSEETAWHRKAPFQGLGEELSLAAYLVALTPQPGDVELMWAAKQANFDTWCGFDSQYLAVEGIDRAIDFARRLDEPRDGDLLSHLIDDAGTARFDDTEIASFVREMGHQFPADPSLEWPVTWVHRVRLLGDYSRGAMAIEAWVTSDDPPNPRSLQHYYASLHLYPAAVAVQRAVVADNSDANRLPSDLARLIELQRLAGDFQHASEDLRRGRRSLKRATDSNRFQHRRIAEEGFLLAAADPDPRRARGSFELAEKVSSEVPSLPFVVLVAGRDAAARVGADDRRAVWAERATAERARIDRELGRSESDED